MAANLSSIYLDVVQDVINSVHADFVSEGIDESILQELQSLWELKLLETGAIQSTLKRPQMGPRGGNTPFHDLNMPYEGPDVFETPTAEILFPPTPVQTPLPETTIFSYLPPGPVPEQPAAYMQQPAHWMMNNNNNLKPFLDVNIAVDESRDDDNAIGQPVTKDFFNQSFGKRKREDYDSNFYPGTYIPQQDGAGDTILLGGLKKLPLQVDGGDDNYDDGGEDYNDPLGGAQQSGDINPPKVEEGGESEESEPPLNENDDDDDLDGFGDAGEDTRTENLVVSQFEKVTKVKGKWKCILKDGIMHLNNKDYLFSKANGEFDFF